MTDPITQMFAQMLEQGQKMAAGFAPAMGKVDMAAMAKLFPTLPKDVAEAWFGKTHNPEGLDAKTRTLVVITGLVVQGAGGEALLRPTIAQALAAGATKREITEVILQCAMFGNMPAIQKAMDVAQAAFAETEESKP
ncbi:MAG: carboxymuconolactone decarboxylase family protein [Cypionkella sp.]|nr:carboxymuconolactone decarboxylase family protein [Cypionkella sp.]